jgi:sodium-dependent dicarboxylate transporter 2/3/5
LHFSQVVETNGRNALPEVGVRVPSTAVAVASAATAVTANRTRRRPPTRVPPPAGNGRTRLPLVEKPHPGRKHRQRARRAVLAGGVVAAAALYLAPSPPGLAEPGKAAFAIFLGCTTLWITNSIPVGITGLLAVALLAATGVMPAAEVFAAFGSSAVFFILGVFILAAGLIRSGLSKRIALQFLVHFGGSPRRLGTGMMLIAMLLTVVMPAQAAVAMLFPIAFELAHAMRLHPGASRYGTVLFLSLAWGAMVGSNASFLGSTRAPLALGMLWTTHATTITFGEWLLAAFPVVALGILTLPLILTIAFRAEPVDASAARASLETAVAALGPMGRQQVKVGAVALVTVLAWITIGGRRVDFAVIALLGAAAMFALGALSWEDLEGHVHWNVILMYGGAIALGVAIDRAGVARWVATGAFGDTRIPALAAVVGLAVATIVLSEFMSNVAAVAVMLPLGFSLGEPLGIPPATLVLSTSIGAGLAFTLPISSAPNTIAFASRYVGVTDFVRAGTMMTALSIAILIAVAAFWWPLIGLL